MNDQAQFEKWVETEMRGFAGGLSLEKDQTDSGWTYFTKAAETAWRAWQAARAQGGQSAGQIAATLEHTEPEPVGFIPSSGLNNLDAGHPAKIYPMNAAPSPFESRALVYTQPAQQGSVPAPEVLADSITDRLFLLREGVYRIQLMVGNMYSESGAGGFDKSSFARWLAGALRDILPVTAPRTAKQGSVPAEWRECLLEMVQAMHDYEMSVDEDAPYKHRAMMDRAHALLSTTTAPQAEEADMFWDADSPDMAEQSPDDLADYCGQDMRVGDSMVINVLSAKTLPVRQMRVWVDGGDDLQWEWFYAQPPAPEGEGDE